jgi:hypothetical protein
MRKSCGKVVGLGRLACVRFGHLATTNVSSVLVVVRKYPHFARSLQPLIHRVMHRVFNQFLSVRSGLIPTIPSTYKENNKRIYTFFYTYKGAY